MKKLIDPFLVTLLCAVALASVLPARGAAATTVDTLSTAAIVLLFFLHGARLARENLMAALGHWRLHLTILSVTFVLFPLLGLGLSIAFHGVLSAALWTGVLFLCALPSTVQSSIAFTSIARGNVAGTIASAATSNLLGIGLTPLIVSLVTKAHGVGVSLSGIWRIVEQLLVPFTAGHLLRPWIGSWVAGHKRLLGLTDRATVILAVYSAFSAAVVEGIWQRVSITDLLLLVLVNAVLLTAILLLSRLIARRLGFSKEDEISIVLCGSKKSLVSGVPIMIFHQMQLMVCAWLARRYGARAGGPGLEEP